MNPAGAAGAPVVTAGRRPVACDGRRHARRALRAVRRRRRRPHSALARASVTQLLRRTRFVEPRLDGGGAFLEAIDDVPQARTRPVQPHPPRRRCAPATRRSAAQAGRPHRRSPDMKSAAPSAPAPDHPSAARAQPVRAAADDVRQTDRAPRRARRSDPPRPTTPGRPAPPPRGSAPPARRSARSASLEQAAAASVSVGVRLRHGTRDRMRRGEIVTQRA